jgi:hypothetical protein
MASHAGKPLSTISEAVLEAAHRHGQAADDQSLLLVRCQRRVV